MLPYPYGARLARRVRHRARPAPSPASPPASTTSQAGALPLVALTAWQALVDTADVRPGQRVLIHAAAGGVGHLAVQIAKARGAHVIGTASAGKHDFLRSSAPTSSIDYRATDFAEAARDMDVVLDPIGGPEHRTRSLRTLKRGGMIVSILPSGRDELVAEAERLGVRAEVMLVEADHAGMSAIADLVEEGALRAVVAGTFPLAEAAKAHAIGERGRTAGKLVLEVD